VNLGGSPLRGSKGHNRCTTRLKSLVNQVQNYGSKRWMDHEVVRLMLQSFTVLEF
jgi:hypothetical protein